MTGRRGRPVAAGPGVRAARVEWPREVDQMDQEQSDAGMPPDWAGLVGRRIDRAIAELRADPAAAKELHLIRLRAKLLALEGLGLDELERTLATIRGTRELLARQEADALRAALARVRGVDADRIEAEELGEAAWEELEAAQLRREEEEEARLRSKSEVGRRLQELEAARGALPEVLPLAMAPAEVRSLWASLAAAAGLPLGRLERLALGIEAPAD